MTMSDRDTVPPAGPGGARDTGEPGAPGGEAAPARHGLARRTAATVAATAGLALIGAAAFGVWSDHHARQRPVTPAAAYRSAGSLWRDTPVDTLFPPVLDGRGAGPGGSDRTWTRVALAPDAGCDAALPADWRAVLAPTGCTRVLRATYTDATRSALVSVGLVFTPADGPAMATLRGRLPVPPGYGFADGQRGAWTVSVLPEAPVLVYAVSAFADGRPVAAPRPAGDAVRKDDTSAVAQAGLGYEAKGVADRIERALRTLAAPPTATPRATPEPPR
ncbi:hypothetical protein OHS33_07270 [Streptomyces sp. NBC_00536]|uniref:hypothetical protein n=1 Tax=Streptomyces sp. NBC_00536 TaxID=2975769 RepID=UPI002E7FE37B|nr:hypothetical protein [Streptomyces sp. NBC_00536]WUC78160.1 hypothetical protein OHS33_07270 [Streptomyces sp. NBC_00536]